MKLLKIFPLSLVVLLICSCTSIPASNMKDLVSSKQQTETIGVGDILSIKVVDAPEFAEDYKVDNTGKITLPYIGRVEVGGLNIEQAHELISLKLAHYFKKPNVTINTSQKNSYKIYFAGEFNVNGVRPLDQKISLLQALSVSGGLNNFATGRLVLHRELNGKIKRFAANISEIERNDGDIGTIVLLPNDVLMAE